MAKENNMEDTAGSLKDVSDASKESLIVSPLVNHVLDLFNKSETARRFDEDRWIRAYRNYRGLYGPDVQFTEAEKSRVFVKVTKTKVLAAYGQIIDVLFANNSFPLSVEPTVLPEGVVEDVHFDLNEKRVRDAAPNFSPYGYRGDGKDLPPGATYKDLVDRLGPLTDELSGIQNLNEGPGVAPSAVTYSPAMVAAKKMEKKIHDQLEESNATKQLRSAAFELALFGTGIMKGPFAVDKEYANWDDEGNYDPTIKTVPQSSHVSVWNAYTDPDAINMDESQFFIERHKLSRSQLRTLKKRPMFRANVIEDVIDMGENYVKKYWEDDLSDYQTDTGVNRFEVLEYWGIVDREMLEDNNVQMPTEFKDMDQLQANIWLCNGRIIRLVLNPFKPTKIPYYVVPYELNPYSMFGVGVAENMDDTQTLMNGFMRMAVDNAVLSGNLVFEVDETN
jgi:hypothetical protein